MASVSGFGQVVEMGPVDVIYGTPQHPYTRALLASRLSMDPEVRIEEPPLSGDPPNPIAPPSGCRFRTRCPHAHDICARATPQLSSHLTSAMHGVACHLYDAASGHPQAIRSGQGRLTATSPSLPTQKTVVQPEVPTTDEPTTALDATVQIQVLILLRQLQQELGMGVIFVTHDLGVAAEVADTIAVMYAGRLVEKGRAQDVLRPALHPYTAGMLASTIVGQQRGSPIAAIPGAPPDLRRLPPGCSFAPRCSYATAACTATIPPAQHFAAGRMARCLRLNADGVLDVALTS